MMNEGEQEVLLGVGHPPLVDGIVVLPNFADEMAVGNRAKLDELPRKVTENQRPSKLW